MKRFSVALFLALVMTVLVVIPTLAQGSGHIYGVVYVDVNGSAWNATATGYVNDTTGNWRAEPGVADVAIHFSGNPNPDRRPVVTLRSAWTDNRSSAVSGSQSTLPADLACTHLRDLWFGRVWGGNAVDHKNVPQGCSGTFGLRPLPVGGIMYVWIDVPAGFTYGRADGLGTRANPYAVPALAIDSWAGWLEFPLQVNVGTTTQVATTPPGRQVYIARPSFHQTRAVVGAYPASPF